MRAPPPVPHAVSVAGPAITVSAVAQFGGARLGDGNSVGFDFNQDHAGHRQPELDQRPARLQGRHRRAVKRDRRVAAINSSTFPNTAYLAAKQSRIVRLQPAQQVFGNLSADYNSGFYGMCVQDDWQLPPQLRLLYGVRYDLFDVPSARPFASNPFSQNFTVDKNNFGPRAGLSWAVDSSARTVVSASGCSE